MIHIYTHMAWLGFFEGVFTGRCYALAHRATIMARWRQKRLDE